MTRITKRTFSTDTLKRRCLTCMGTIPIDMKRGTKLCSYKCSKLRSRKYNIRYSKLPQRKEMNSRNNLLSKTSKRPEYYKKIYRRYMWLAQKMKWDKE